MNFPASMKAVTMVLPSQTTARTTQATTVMTAARL